MHKAKGLTRNPLGIIALFISLIYGFACLVLSTSISNLTSQFERLPLIWFIILFPIVILGGFIFLVIRHHEKLYAPSDYSDEQIFTKTFSSKNSYREVKIKYNKQDNKEPKSLKQAIIKAENLDFNDVYFSDRGKRNLELANLVSDSVSTTITKELFKKNVLIYWTFEVHAPEYYLMNFEFNKKFFPEQRVHSVTVIMRITEISKNKYAIIGIGKGILVESSDEFSKQLRQFIFDKFLSNGMKKDEYERLKIN